MEEDLKKVVENLISNLSLKQKEVIWRRFALNGFEKETLEKIGKDFGVTRERIRQIQNSAFSALRKDFQKPEINAIFSKLEKKLSENFNIKRRDIFLKELNQGNLENEIAFLIKLNPKIFEFKENEDFYAFYYLDEKNIEDLKEIYEKLNNILENQRKLLEKEEILKLFAEEKEKFLENCLEIFKQIKKSYLGGYGKIQWPQVSPKGIGDRIYIVLEKEAKPLHFREIAKACDTLFSDQGKKVILQTVHNELIRDERFVLIGRGIYGLKNWGYEKGTVREMISKILKNSEKPLKKEEILEKVLQQRQIKPETILINLYNKKYFQKDNQGRYHLKTELG
ncbi:MAG: sigma factor-like helix-turn-helix DNA-binding protein [Minisyncoccia bacterium]